MRLSIRQKQMERMDLLLREEQGRSWPFSFFFADHNGYSLRQFTRNRLPLNIIAAARRASYFSPTFYLLPCCFLQISGLLAVGNPRNPRFIQFEGSRCKCPEITFLRKLDAFKIRVVTNLDSLLSLSEKRKTVQKPTNHLFPFQKKQSRFWINRRVLRFSNVIERKIEKFLHRGIKLNREIFRRHRQPPFAICYFLFPDEKWIIPRPHEISLIFQQSERERKKRALNVATFHM